MSHRIWGLCLAGLTLAGAAAAQNADNQVSPAAKPGGWVAPGTPGSPIDGTIFHAQVLLDAAGFRAGVIDGKKGMTRMMKPGFKAVFQA